jgi:hypothetical protein
MENKEVINSFILTFSTVDNLKAQSVYDEWSKAERRETFQEHDW